MIAFLNNLAVMNVFNSSWIEKYNSVADISRDLLWKDKIRVISCNNNICEQFFFIKKNLQRRQVSSNI